MVESISQRELRNNSGEIMRRVAAGESFVVTSNGTPVAEVVPLRKRQFIPTDELIERWKDLPPIDYQQFRKDVDAILGQRYEPRYG